MARTVSVLAMTSTSATSTALVTRFAATFPLKQMFKVICSLTNMRTCPHHSEGERGIACLLRGHLLLEALCVALISQNLLLLERLLSKPYLNFYNWALINNSSSRLTLVYKEFVSSNLDGLALFEVAHKASKEVWLQNLILYQLDSLVSLAICLVEGFLSGPDRGDPHNSHTFGHAWVHFYFSTIGNGAKKGSAVLNEKLMVLDLKDLAFEEARADAVGEVGLQHAL